jgi:hypothetical protein
MSAPSLPQAFSPASHVETLIQAVLPLVDHTDGTVLRPGCGISDVIEALTPYFGDYTVADAALMFDFIEAAQEICPGANPAPGVDDPRGGAVFQIRKALEYFACSAQASSPRCVEVRPNLLDAADKDEIGLDGEDDLRRSIKRDIKQLLRSDFSRGERFGSDNWRQAWIVRHGEFLDTKKEE